MYLAWIRTTPRNDQGTSVFAEIFAEISLKLYNTSYKVTKFRGKLTKPNTSVMCILLVSGSQAEIVRRIASLMIIISCWFCPQVLRLVPLYPNLERLNARRFPAKRERNAQKQIGLKSRSDGIVWEIKLIQSFWWALQCYGLLDQGFHLPDVWLK